MFQFQAAFIHRSIEYSSAATQLKKKQNFPKLDWRMITNRCHLPFFVHVRLSAEIILPQFWFGWCNFEGELLTGCVIGRLNTIALQTSHAWKTIIAWNIYRQRDWCPLSESHQMHFYCWHRGKNINRHPWARSSVSTRHANDCPISADSQSNPDAERHSVAIANYAYLSRATGHFASMHDWWRPPNGW